MRLDQPVFIIMALLAAALLGAPPTAPAQGSTGEPPGLALRVVDPSDVPVARAQVAVAGTSLSGVSNDSGWVRLRAVPPGRASVRVTRLGYRPSEFALEVPAAGVLEADVELVPDPVPVQGATAVGTRENRALRMEGFYRRKQMGGGTFLTREEVEKTGAHTTSGVFRRVRGVRVTYAGKGKYKLQSVRYSISMSQERAARPGAMSSPSNRKGGAGGSVCEMLVFLNGAQVSLEGIDDIPLESIEAIEVYRGPADAPPEYNVTNSACGLVVVWTRVGA